MARCDHCGAECALPFTCQHCGGKFCENCRLPPSHECTNLSSWNKRPRPSISLNYGKSGTTVTGGGYLPDSRASFRRKQGKGMPYLWIMIGVIALVLIALAWLVLTGH